jgi:hypothetical protein
MNKSKLFSIVAVFALFAVSTASAAFMFNTNLGFGMRNSDVRELQLRLNTEVGTTLPGTTYYGPATRAAVVAYQKMKAIAPAIGYTGPLTRAALNGSTTTTPTTPTTPVVTGPVSVMLAASNPVANYIYAGQATAKLLDVTFSGNGTVSSVMLKRSGFSNQSTLRNVYLYDGVTRLTDGYSFNSNGDITINNLNMMVSGSKTISVVADVDSLTASGQTIAVALSGYNVAGSTSATTVTVQGNTMSVASGSGILAGIAYNGTNTVATANVNAGTSSYAVWRQGVQVNTRALSLKAANFRITGSAPADALANVKLFVNGVDAGVMGTMTTQNGSNYITFNMSSAPVTLNTGTHTVEVRADIVKGSSYNFTVSLQQASDLMVTDPQIGVNVAITGASSSTAGTVTILAGAATMTIDPTFNALTNVTGGASNATIAKFKIQGYGEDVKVYEVDVTPVLGVMTPAAAGLQNVTLYFNGSQVGTQTATWSAGVITFTLGSQMIIPAGQTSTLEVKADLRTTGGANYTAGTISANAAIAQADMEGMTSKAQPSGSLSATGNSLTVQTATLGVSQNASYASQTVSPNTAAQKIGSFILQNQSSSESVRVTSLNVALGGSALTTNFGGLYTSENTGYKIQPQASNVFSVDFTLAPGATKIVDIFADTNSATGVNVITTMTVSSIGVSSNVNTTGTAIVGQTITLNSGVLGTPVFLASNSTNAQYVASPLGKTDATKATYTFNSTGGVSTISELKFTVTGTNTVSAVKVGTVSAPVVAGVAWLQGLSIPVTNGGSGTNVDAMVSYTTVGQAGTASVLSDATSQIALTYVKYSSGGTTVTLTPTVNANTMTLTAATPTVKKTSSPTSVGVGTISNVKVGTVTVTANDGDIKIGNVPVTFSSLGSNAGWVVKVNGTAPAGITQPTSDTSGFSFATGYQIQKGTSVAFDLFADVTNSGTTAGNVDITLGAPASFTWSDIVDGVMTKTGTLLTTYNQ